MYLRPETELCNLCVRHSRRLYGTIFEAILIVGNAEVVLEMQETKGRELDRR